MYKKSKKIPTIFALFLLIAGIMGTYYLDLNYQTMTISAKAYPKPEKIHVTNLTHQSFTISWLTDTPVLGNIEISGTGKKMIQLDDLDSDNISRPRTVHSFTIKNLDEAASYNIKLVSGNKCIDDNCPSISQKTLSRKISSINLPPIRGQITNPDNSHSAGTLVYVVVGQSLPLSTRTDSSGLWVITLNNLQIESNMEKLVISDNDLVQITAESGLDKNSSAVIDVKSIRQNLTVPSMQIGNTYNFVDLLSQKDLMAKSNNRAVLGTQSFQPSGKVIDILFPSYNGDITTDSRPRFRGTGPKNREILITINSSPQTGKVTVGSDGVWNWRPPIDIPPGKHTITVGYNDKGKLVTVTKNFLVTKSGEGFVLGIEATPSATLIPSPTVTLIPISPSVIPSITVLPSATVIPTATVPPVVVTVTPPRTGGWQPTILLLSFGTILMGIGAKILFFP